MFIDDIIIFVAAGDGGRGAVAFNKNAKSLGPVGGSGGNGGNIYIEGVADLGILRQFRFKRKFFAQNGENGKGQFIDGKDGKDLVLKVPTGTVIHNLENNNEQEIISIGQSLLVAKGGQGGKGNFHFRSSRNTSPTEFQEGTPGEKNNLQLELKLIADIGLIGLPNAGKSSLINELTNAKSKVAHYQFTTLEPNLGAYHELVLVDIPGLIEGASSGKGLGIKFLRHIERTKILFHLVSSESSDPAKDYKTIKQELESYNKTLLNKKEYLFLTKSDIEKSRDIKKKLAVLKKLNKDVMSVSIYDFDSIEKVKKILNLIIKTKYEKKP